MNFTSSITSSDVMVLFSFGIFTCSLFRLLSKPTQPVHQNISNNEIFLRNCQIYKQIKQKERIIKKEEKRISEHLRVSVHHKELDSLSPGSLLSDISQVAKENTSKEEHDIKSLYRMQKKQLKNLWIAIVSESFIMMAALFCAIII